MNPVSEQFANLTATLEDMHTVAVMGQSADLADDEASALLAELRRGARRLGRQMLDTATAL